FIAMVINCTAEMDLASGYGTQSVRLGKDAIKDFDCCCLSLQTCRDPVVTPDGYLYEKQAILEYILHQKTEIAKKMKVTETDSDTRLESKSEERWIAERFKTRENSIVSKPINPFTFGKPKSQTARAGASASTSKADSYAPAAGTSSSQSLPSFWIPSLTPEAKPTMLKKPSKTVVCPMSGRPLKMNELINVHFTPLDPSLDRVALLARPVNITYMFQADHHSPCAQERLNDYCPIALTMLAMKCFERLVMAHINTIIPETRDPLPFSFHPNRSTDDAISTSHCPFPPVQKEHLCESAVH
uniref:Nitric oxide synthase-interacting protein n=1 Tax=Hucho hucho TaxID=62062 RepID=A0A4W5KCV6_9TELE